VQCHDESLRLFKDGVNHFLASNIKSMCPRPQKVQLCTILGVKRASFPRLFGHYSGRNNAANKFVRCYDMSLRLSKGSINHFYVSIIKYVCPRALKIQLCTIFRGRTDRHFRGLFAIIRGALQLCLHNAKLGHKVYLGRCEPSSVVQHKIHVSSCWKGTRTVHSSCDISGQSTRFSSAYTTLRAVKGTT
jgi:hypothetical protein